MSHPRVDSITDTAPSEILLVLIIVLVIDLYYLTREMLDYEEEDENEEELTPKPGGRLVSLHQTNSLHDKIHNGRWIL